MLSPVMADAQVGAWGYHTGTASGYKKPELLGVLACGTASARPLVMGLLKGVLLIELAGTEILGLVA